MLDLSAVSRTPWLMEPRDLRLALHRLALMPTCPSARQLVEERRERLAEARRSSTRAKQRVGVISILGPVDQRMTAALDKLGGVSCEEISAALTSLVEDSRVSAVILQIDSPGGGVYGVAELADQIREARAKKRIVAVADSMMASAAYWIGSAASELYCTPGGDVGSVGVYAVHVDESVALDKAGIKMTLVKSGRYKAEMASHEPLTDAARDHLQESVDQVATKFVEAVAVGRGVSTSHVLAHFGQGRLVPSRRALTARMIDGVATFEEVARAVVAGEKPAGRKVTSSNPAVQALVDQQERRHAQRERLTASCRALTEERERQRERLLRDEEARLERAESESGWMSE